MKVFIMRHGQAEGYAASDEERQLTIQGISQSEQIAHWLNATYDVEFDYVLVSPYIRAQQTWKAIEPILNISQATVEISNEITPYGDSDHVVDFVKALGSVKNLKNILIISHLPLVGYLTADFVAGMMAPMFPTSAISCVEVESKTSKGELLWIQKP